MDDKTVKADLMVVQLDRARTALAEAKTIGETKKIMDMAHAAQIYARRQQLGEEAMAYALAIKIEALRKLGEMLAVTPKQTGGDAYRARFQKGIEVPTALVDLGIDGKTSMMAQQLAAMPAEQFEQVREGVQTVSEALKYMRQEKVRDERVKIGKQMRARPDAPIIQQSDAMQWIKHQPQCDLLLTDPPFMTDVPDISQFVEWLPLAWSKVKSTGRAYVFVGAYPAELRAYLNVCERHNLPLAQVLTWTYRNTMGPAPKMQYFLNYQAVLYFVGSDAGELDCPLLTELCASQDMAHPARSIERVYQWQKPDDLIEGYIRHATKAGDLVLDPFAGSGTTLLAAARLGRLARGCEIKSDVVKIAVERGCIRHE